MTAITPGGAVLLGHLGVTTVVETVNATPGSYEPTGSETSFVLLSDTVCHISTSGTATTDDFMLLPGVYATVYIDRAAAESISWVVGDAASDGTLRLTPCNPKV
jgi:hypothetical protein